MDGTPLLDPAKAAHMANLMKAIAHPVRLRVLALLRDGEANVTQITGSLGLTQAAISNQLAILRMKDLVEVRRAGGFAWYRLNRPRLGELLKCLEGGREAAGATRTTRPAAVAAEV